MDHQEALAIRDIHLPAPVGWWPPAPGWWGLLIAFALLLATLTWLRWRRTRKAVKKIALRELFTLRIDTGLQDSEKVRRLSVLMRRIAVSTYPRTEVAGLTGAAWLDFLDGSTPHKPFAQGAGRLLADAPYRSQLDEDLGELFALCEDWIRRLPEAKR